MGRPHPREVVIYEAVPNELPRVAGIITTVRQAPLSHVNLRAVQDDVPNAYVRDVLDDPDVAALVGGFVRYEVTESGWSLRAATPDEVDEHYESARPSQTQTPPRGSVGHVRHTVERCALRGLDRVRGQGRQCGGAGPARVHGGDGARGVRDPILLL